MAWNPVTDRNDGQDFDGAAWQSAIDSIQELQQAIGPDVPAHPLDSPIRHRRRRSNVTLSTGGNPMFPNNLVGITDENVGGITFTADGTNGFFTVPASGTYGVTLWAGTLTASLTNTSRMLITLAGSSYEEPAPNGSGRASVSMIRFLTASSTVTFAIINNSGGALDTTTYACEIYRMGP